MLNFGTSGCTGDWRAEENLRCAQVSSARVPAARLLNVFVWKTLRVSHTPTGAPLRRFLFSRKRGYPPPSLIQARASVPHAVGGGRVFLLRCGRAKREPHGRPFRQSATLAKRRKKKLRPPRAFYRSTFPCEPPAASAHVPASAPADQAWGFQVLHPLMVRSHSEPLPPRWYMTCAKGISTVIFDSP